MYLAAMHVEAFGSAILIVVSSLHLGLSLITSLTTNDGSPQRPPGLLSLNLLWLITIMKPILGFASPAAKNVEPIVWRKFFARSK